MTDRRNEGVAGPSARSRGDIPDRRGPGGLLPSVPMDARLRDRLALVIALVAVAAGMGAFLFARDTGLQLEVEGDELVVDEVAQRSPADAYGVRPGMVVIEVDGTALYRFPEPVYRDVNRSDPGSGEEWTEQQFTGWIPAAPTRLEYGAEHLQTLADQPLEYLVAADLADLALSRGEEGWQTTTVVLATYDLEVASLVFFVGIVLFAGGAWLLLSGRAGPNLRDLALPLATATAAPFLLWPLGALWYPLAGALHGLALPLAMVPLAAALVDRIEDPADRRLIVYLTAGAGVLAAVAAVTIATSDTGQSPTSWVWWALVGFIPLFPGLVAAGPITTNRLRGDATSSGRLLQSTEFAVAGFVPMLALASPGNGPWFVPLSLWLIAMGVAGRFTVRPLARLATRAQLQRDLVVAATEAERARVAADIHDDALQELTLLVRRLDTAGDAEGAALARTVSDRLRAICGDLRLPILDDLGVGPALDWLVLRIERLAGGEVRLERNDPSRPPADVELAFFRVAQEALSNAVKHGRAPIVVRYQSSESGVSLSVDDSGPGIAPDAGAAVDGSGHFGLLNMQQRAEQIGAILDIRQWPGGGTHVALEWRPQ